MPSPPHSIRYGPMAAAVAVLSLLGNDGVDGFAPTRTASTRPPAIIGGDDAPRGAATTELLLGSDTDQGRVVALAFDDGGGSGVQEEETNETITQASALWASLTGGGPPLDIDDTELLLYDVFLLVNLSVSISYLVVHRMNIAYVPSGLNEGALLSICWIVAGLANGAFLNSAVDGHYHPADAEYETKGGPKAAGLLAVSTFVTTSSLRIVVALIAAVMQHRRVGVGGEELIPLEILFGLVLMSAWRFLHSANTPRI